MGPAASARRVNLAALARRNSPLGRSGRSFEAGDEHPRETRALTSDEAPWASLRARAAAGHREPGCDRARLAGLVLVRALAECIQRGWGPKNPALDLPCEGLSRSHSRRRLPRIVSRHGP